MFFKICSLKSFMISQEITCVGASFLIKFFKNFIKKEVLAQVFSFEFCEMFKNNYFVKLLLVFAKINAHW